MFPQIIARTRLKILSDMSLSIIAKLNHVEWPISVPRDRD